MVKNHLYQGINKQTARTDENSFTHFCSLCSLMLLWVCVWFYLYRRTEEKWLNDLQMNKYHHINYSRQKWREKESCNHFILKRRVVFSLLHSFGFSLNFWLTSCVWMRGRKMEETWKSKRNSVFITGNKGEIQIFHIVFSSLFQWCEIFGCTKTMEKYGVHGLN